MEGDKVELDESQKWQITELIRGDVFKRESSERFLHFNGMKCLEEENVINSTIPSWNIFFDASHKFIF